LFTVKRERGLLPLVFGMKVGNPMLTIEHADYDAEECRNYGHASVLSQHLKAA
jgi:hypothetical protein